MMGGGGACAVLVPHTCLHVLFWHLRRVNEVYGRLRCPGAHFTLRVKLAPKSKSRILIAGNLSIYQLPHLPSKPLHKPPIM